MSKRRSPLPALGAVLTVVAVGAVSLWRFAPDAWFGGEDEAALEGVPVRRGPMRISVVERGNLKSANATDIQSEVEGQAAILYLIEEGTHVEVGDLLCELDASEIEERLVAQRIATESAEAAAVNARQRLDIQKSQNQSDIDAAERRVEFAKIDLEKYIQGDWPQQLKDADDDIFLREEELKRARDKVEWSRKLAERGFITRTELEADELAEARAELALEKSRRSKELLEDYDYPKQVRSLEADVEEARNELARVKLRSNARLVDYESDLRSAESKLELELEKLAKREDQVEKARILSPVSGMVVYSQQGRSRWRNDEPIQKGTVVRERDAIITIPSTDSMIAEVSLHEAVLEQVREGMPCQVTVDALPGRLFEGRVKLKSQLPDQNSWFANPNQRLYRTEVAIAGDWPEMRPGMSCSVEVICEDIGDALQVPLQSVFLDRGEPIVFVLEGGAFTKRPVEVDGSNTQFYRVVSGVSEGEVVALTLPDGASLEPAPEPELPEEDAPGDGAPGSAPRAASASGEAAYGGGGREGGSGWSGGGEERRGSG